MDTPSQLAPRGTNPSPQPGIATEQNPADNAMGQRQENTPEPQVEPGPCKTRRMKGGETPGAATRHSNRLADKPTPGPTSIPPSTRTTAKKRKRQNTQTKKRNKNKKNAPTREDLVEEFFFDPAQLVDDNSKLVELLDKFMLQDDLEQEQARVSESAPNRLFRGALQKVCKPKSYPLYSL
jgi:hypothetical protein